jgi:hypothetical protein
MPLTPSGASDSEWRHNVLEFLKNGLGNGGPAGGLAEPRRLEDA